MDKRIPINWVSHLSDYKDKKDFEVLIRNSSQLLDRLQELIDMKYYEAEKLRLSKHSYDSPNWAYSQADITGYQRALKEISALINFRE